MSLRVANALVCVTWLITAAAACDGGSPHLPIAGGGATGGRLSGRLHVFVTDSVTEQPIANADVWIGETAPLLHAVTSNTGEVEFRDGSLRDAATITAAAADYVPNTWFGVGGRDVTIQIARRELQLPRAQVSGTIAGWFDLPAIPAGQLRIATVTYSSAGGWIGSLHNGVTQIEHPGPTASCLQGDRQSCSFTLDVRAGKVVLYAAILRVGPVTTTLEGMALLRGLELAPGEVKSGVALEIVAPLATTTIPVTAPQPLITPEVANVAVVADFGAEGSATLGSKALTSPITEVPVPVLSGPLAGVSLRLAAGYTDGVGGASFTMSAASTEITSSGASTAPWLEQPVVVAVSDEEYSFSAPDTTPFTKVSLEQELYGKMWNAVIFDGRQSFRVPPIEPSPFVDREATRLRVQRLDVTLDPASFDIPSLSSPAGRGADALLLLHET